MDIDIEQSIEKYNEEQVLGELLRSPKKADIMYHLNKYRSNNFKLEFNDTWKINEHQTLDLWCESTKVIDYLNEVRIKTVDGLRKAQEESLESYKNHSSRLKTQLTTVKSIDELKSILFSDKFYFQVHFTQSKDKLWAFNIYTFVTDFYMSSSDINILE